MLPGGRAGRDHLSERLTISSRNAQQICNHQRDVGNRNILDQLALAFGNDFADGIFGQLFHIRLVCLQAGWNEQTVQQ